MLSLGLILAVFTVNAQDQKAKKILDKVSQKTRSYKTISADFIFTMENKEMDIHEKNKGSIKLKGQKYVVNLPDDGNENIFRRKINMELYGRWKPGNYFIY